MWRVSDTVNGPVLWFVYGSIVDLRLVILDDLHPRRDSQGQTVEVALGHVTKQIHSPQRALVQLITSWSGPYLSGRVGRSVLQEQVRRG